jgi:hypothetical protein
VPQRSRMIVDLPADIQMAIRLRAVKTGKTTGEVVAEAICSLFAEDVAEALRVIKGE